MDRSFLLGETSVDSSVERLNVVDDADLRTFQVSLKTWRELDGKFRFIVDNDGTILAGEDEFFDSHIGGTDFDRSGGRMRPVDRRFQGPFSRLLRCTTPTTALIPKAMDGGHWVCRAVSLATKQAPDHGNAHRLALTVHGAGASDQVEWADFRTAFGLTDTENRVLRLMMSGHCAVDIANHESVSINTVRTHIRHVHEKLGVGDAYELWLRVGDYRLL